MADENLTFSNSRCLNRSKKKNLFLRKIKYEKYKKLINKLKNVF